jgi:trigger factor
VEGIELNSTENTGTNETAINETAINETATGETETENTGDEQLEAGAGGDHEHEHGHEHGHDHGPSLNPLLTREIAVEVPADEVSKAYRTVIKRYQKQARIPGFRAGKVPESLVRSKFARELREEVLQALVSALQGCVRGAAGVRCGGL